MRIYLSHAMSGSPDHGVSRAKRLAAEVRSAYPHHELVVPHEMPDDDNHKLSACQAIALAEGWTLSTECRDEFEYAAANGMDMFLVREGVPGFHKTELVKLW